MNKKTFLTLFSIFFAFFLYPTEQKVFIIPIEGEINKSLMVFIRRNIEKAKMEKATHIIFELNTFGGRVDSALQITTIIGSLKDIKTIAYIPSKSETFGVSWSAGALIAFSCNKIYMSEGTSIGAAAPVYQTQEGVQMAPEKIVSPLRTQMASLAEKNGYPKNIAIAMVDLDVEIYEVYLNNNLIIAQKEEIQELQKKAQKEKQSFEVGKLISPKGKLLTLTYKEMEQYKISAGTFSSTEALIKELGIYNIVQTKESPVDKIIAFLTSSAVSSILIAIALAALYLEIKTPGFGIPGVTSIIAFLIIFSTNMLLGKAGSFEILLFILGGALLVIELFLIPGFGITGITGLALIFLSLIFSLQDFIIPTVSWQWTIATENIVTIALGIISSIFIMAVLAPILPKTLIFKKLTLQTEQKAEEGFVAREQKMDTTLIGKIGFTTTILRPVGKAKFEEEVIEVESDGEFIDKDQKVEVIKILPDKIIVKRV